MTEQATEPKDAEELEEGQYIHTFFQIWDNVLEGNIHAAEAPLALDVAASIIDSYPWLNHENVQQYRRERAALLKEAREIIFEILGTKKTKIYKENINDWKLHKDMYIELIARWNLLVSGWGNAWTEQAETAPSATGHAAIGDVAGILLNPEYGFVEGLKTLKGFEFTVEDREALNEKMGLKNDE